VGAKQVFFALAAFGMVAQPVTLHPIHGTTFGANDFHGLLHFTPPFTEKLINERKPRVSRAKKYFPLHLFRCSGKSLASILSIVHAPGKAKKSNIS
jgi:hypothetical protein